jgi:hypothetical protein
MLWGRTDRAALALDDLDLALVEAADLDALQRSAERLEAALDLAMGRLEPILRTPDGPLVALGGVLEPDWAAAAIKTIRHRTPRARCVAIHSRRTGPSSSGCWSRAQATRRGPAGSVVTALAYRLPRGPLHRRP